MPRLSYTATGWTALGICLALTLGFGLAASADHANASARPEATIKNTNR